MIFFQNQQKEIEEEKKKLEEEKEEFKRKMRQSEEERKAMEAKMSDRIQDLEAKMRQMNKPGQMVRNVMKYYQERLFKYWVDIYCNILGGI